MARARSHSVALRRWICLIAALLLFWQQSAMACAVGSGVPASPAHACAGMGGHAKGAMTCAHCVPATSLRSEALPQWHLPTPVFVPPAPAVLPRRVTFATRALLLEQPRARQTHAPPRLRFCSLLI